MSSSDKEKKQGFASLPPEKHKEVSARGGRAKVPKGFALTEPSQRSMKASLAAKARWAKVHAERAGKE